MNKVENMVACPSQTELCRYLNEQLDQYAVAQVEEHVETCEQCEIRIKRLLDESVFLGLETPTIDRDLQSPPEFQHYKCEESKILGSGGFGVVWKMRDTRLNRDVAVKVMKFRDAEKQSLLRRFLSEAQICSQLSHPFIVPVYDMGQLPDGRGFYVMKLVEGAGLGEDLSNPGDQWMPRIQVFGHICQAIAYAHAKNVIHRDLKPQNIMVGSHGEIQVMDWGLAKVVSEAPEQNKDWNGDHLSVLETARLEIDQTAEAAIGTYPYMPPEQARSATTTDYRSDVFSLGSILCELLTGSPTYRGATQAEVQQKAINAELLDAMSRLSECSADQRIISIAKDSISADADRRPANADELSKAIQNFINEVEVELQEERMQNERQQQKVTEELKRRKIRSVLFSTALALIFVIFLSTAHFLQNRRDRQSKAGQLYQDATKLIEKGDFIAANEKLNLSNELAGNTSSNEDFLADTKLCLKLEALAEELNVATKGELSHQLLIHDDTESNNIACKNYSLLLSRFLKDKSLVSKTESSPAKDWIIVGLIRWSFAEYSMTPRDVSKCNAILDVVKKLDVDNDSKDQIYDISNWNNPQQIVEAVLGEGQRSIGQLHTALKLAIAGKVDHELGNQILENLADDYLANYTWGTALATRNLNDDAIRYCQASVSLRPTSPYAHLNLGNLLANIQQFESSLRHLKIAKKDTPDQATALNNIGTVYRDMGIHQRAIQSFEAAIENIENPKYVWPYVNLAKSHLKLGDVQKAEVFLNQAIAINPDDRYARYSMGVFLFEQGKFAESVANYKIAIKSKPDYSEAWNNLGNSLTSLSAQMKEKGKLAEAAELFLEAKMSFERAIELDARNARAHINLGNHFNEIGEFNKALELYRTAESIDPSDVLLPVNIAGTLLKLRRYDEAVVVLKTAMSKGIDSGTIKIRLGLALCRAGRFKEGIGLLQHVTQSQAGSGEAMFASSRIEFFKPLLELDRAVEKTPQSLDWTETTDIDELIRLSDYCYYKGLNSYAANIRKRAIELHPGLADITGQLIVSARYAAKAACGAEAQQSEEFVNLSAEWLELAIENLDALPEMDQQATYDQIHNEVDFLLLNAAVSSNASASAKWSTLWNQIEDHRKNVTTIRRLILFHQVSTDKRIQ